MAYSKKTAVNPTEPEEMTTIGETAKENNKDEEIELLKKQNEQLQTQMNALMAMLSKINNGPVEAKDEKNSLLDEVTIVHLVQRAPGLTTFIKLSNLEIAMSEFGEERTIDRRQAEELVGAHRSLFEDGIIAFGNKNEDVAKKLSVKVVSSYGYADSEFVNRLATMSARDLEDLYGKLCEGHRAFVVEYFKRKIMEKNPAFMDVSKIDVLNRLSGKAMFDVLLDKERDDVNDASAKKNK